LNKNWLLLTEFRKGCWDHTPYASQISTHFGGKAAAAAAAAVAIPTTSTPANTVQQCQGQGTIISHGHASFIDFFR